jgi:hypothetical protein
MWILESARMFVGLASDDHQGLARSREGARWTLHQAVLYMGKKAQER